MLLNNKYIIILIIITIICLKITKLKANNMNMIDFYFLDKYFIKQYNKWCSLNSYDKDISFPNMELNFPNHIIFKNNWEIIKEEAMNIYNNGYSQLINTDYFFKIIADNKWRKFYIKWYGSIVDEAYKLCPKTCELISQLPEVKLAMFSILEPGSKIKRHEGPFKGCFRYHLGLNCPKDAFIIVDNIKYGWKDGDDILFDDTFTHEVNNLSNKVRIILFCDVERKMKDAFCEKINKLVIDFVAPITNRTNDLQEKHLK